MKLAFRILFMQWKTLPVLVLVPVCGTWLSAKSVNADPAVVGITTTNQITQTGKIITTKETQLEDAVRTKDVEVRRESDGAVISRYGKVLRSNEVLTAYSWDKVYGKGARSYYHNGKELMCEGDENGDGVSDLLIFFDVNHVPVEVFTKNRDGAVLSVDRNRLEAIRKDYETGDKTVAPVINALGRKTESQDSTNNCDQIQGATSAKPTP